MQAEIDKLAGALGHKYKLMQGFPALAKLRQALQTDRDSFFDMSSIDHIIRQLKSRADMHHLEI